MRPAMTSAALLLALSPLIEADVVRTKDGRVYDGTISERSADSVTIVVTGASGRTTVTLARERIAEIEDMEEGTSNLVEYAHRTRGLDAQDFAAHLAVGRWCLQQGMREQGKAHCLLALAGVAENAEATRLLREYGFDENFSARSAAEGWQEMPFQNWKGEFVSREFALADEAVTRAAEEFDKACRRSDYYNGPIAGYRERWEALEAEWREWSKEEQELGARCDALFDGVMSALGRSASVTVGRTDSVAAATDLRGRWVVAVGRTDTTQVTVTSAALEYEARLIELRSQEAEYNRVAARMNSLAEQIRSLRAEAAKLEPRGQSRLADRDACERKLRAAEERRAEARKRMDVVRASRARQAGVR